MKCIYVYNKIDVVDIDDVDRLARQPNSIVISCSLKDRGGCTVEDFSNHIHRSLIKDVKYVLVWGTSARHYPQHCGLGHMLQDEDVVQIVKKKGEGRWWRQRPIQITF